MPIPVDHIVNTGTEDTAFQAAEKINQFMDDTADAVDDLEAAVDPLIPGRVTACEELCAAVTEGLDGKISHSLSTAENDVLVGSVSSTFIKKTLDEFKTILGLGSAAYTAASAYLAHSLATAENDFLVASGAGAFVKKTADQVKTILGLGSAAYTAASAYLAATALGAASGVASLNASTKVVEDPANAQAAPGVGKIPMGDAVFGRLGLWEFFERNADVTLQRTDANTITLAGIEGISKCIRVANSLVDCSTSLTLDTDSASEFIITGTTTVAKSTALNSYNGNGSDGSAYAAHGLHHVYVCNDAACWQFSSYDRRNKIIVSPNAPTNGYLAASGDGLNARHVGWVICGASRTMDTVLCLASRFNRPPLSNKVDGVTGDTALTPSSGEQDLPNAECQFWGILPEGGTLCMTPRLYATNVDVDGASITAYWRSNSTLEGEHGAWLVNAAGGIYSDIIGFTTFRAIMSTSAALLKLRVDPGTTAGSSPHVVPSGSLLAVMIW